jgi:hypothetical protein
MTDEEYWEKVAQYEKELACFNEHVRSRKDIGPMQKEWLLPLPPVRPDHLEPPSPTAEMDAELEEAFGPSEPNTHP